MSYLYISSSRRRNRRLDLEKAWVVEKEQGSGMGKEREKERGSGMGKVKEPDSDSGREWDLDLDSEKAGEMAETALVGAPKLVLPEKPDQ